MSEIETVSISLSLVVKLRKTFLDFQADHKYISLKHWNISEIQDSGSSEHHVVLTYIINAEASIGLQWACVMNTMIENDEIE